MTTQQDLSKLTNSDYRNYLRTGDIYISPRGINDANTTLTQNPNTFLNGEGIFAEISGGTAGITNLTYNQLTGLTSTSGLTSNNFYRITDYKTVHYMIDDSTRFDDINTGELEPLIVKAAGNSSLFVQAYSEQYPQDIIYYDWNPNNWLSDKGFTNDSNEIIPNFKGVIYRRYDTEQSNDLPYDFRNVKFRRWKFDSFSYPYWDSGSTYNRFDFVQVTGNTGGIYISMVDNNTGNDYLDVNYWVKTNDFAATEYLYPILNTAEPLDYIDCYTFHGFDEYNTYELCVFNNFFENTRCGVTSNYISNNSSILLNSVFYLHGNDNNSQNALVYFNNFGQCFENNTTVGLFYINNFGALNNHLNFNKLSTKFDFGNDVSYVMINQDCGGIKIDNDSNHIYMGSACHEITIGIDNSSLIFADENNDITYGSENYSIVHGRYSYKIVIEIANNNIYMGESNSNIKINNLNERINIGNGNYNIKFDSDSNEITIGNGNHDIILGNANTYITLGDNNNALTFDIQNSYIQFGNDNFHIEMKNDCGNIVSGNGNSNLIFNNNSTQMSIGDNNRIISFGVDNDTIYIESNISHVILGNNNQNITLMSGCTNTKIGSNNTNIIVGKVSDNIQIDNQIGDITLGNGNVYIRIGNGCGDIYLHDDAIFGVFGDNVTFFDVSAITGQTFQNNTISSNIDFTGIDFSSATHIFADYTTEIIKTSTGTIKLKYVDGSDDTLKIVDSNT